MSTTSEASGPVLDVLLCDACRHPVATADDIISEQHPGPARERVYAYPLDLFENGNEVWTYSATNAHDRRFDLICARPDFLWPRELPPSPTEETTTTDAPPRTRDTTRGQVEQEQKRVRLVALHGDYSPVDSFFVGYSWSFCHCGNCGSFLGWGFLRNEKWVAYKAAVAAEAAATTMGVCTGENEEDSEEVRRVTCTVEKPTADFLGIILVHCTGNSEYPVSAFARDATTAAGRCQRQEVVRALRCQLTAMTARMRDGLLGHRLLTSFDRVVLYVLRSPFVAKEDCTILAWDTDQGTNEEGNGGGALPSSTHSYFVETGPSGAGSALAAEAGLDSWFPREEHLRNPRFCVEVRGVLLPFAFVSYLDVAKIALAQEEQEREQDHSVAEPEDADDSLVNDDDDSNAVDIQSSSNDSSSNDSSSDDGSSAEAY